MRRTSFRKWPCSIARTSDLLGDWWTPLVLREVFLGTTRFDDIQKALSIGRNVLTERLRRLVDENVLERRKYQDGPVRYEYLLTEKGRDFYPVILAIVRWGDRWLHDGEAPPVLLRHDACGHITHGEVVCAHCGEALRHREVHAELQDGRDADFAARVAAVEDVQRRAAPRSPSRARAPKKAAAARSRP